MRRALLALAALLVGGICLPPLYYRFFPVESFALPPPGRRVAVADGVFVNVLERGSGPPVVLVHGLPGTAYYFEPILSALAARGHRALAYDRVGYGHSDARRDDYFTAEANARDLLALLAAEDLHDATLVGWSFGGKAALGAALRDPSRVGRLVLLASAGRWDGAPAANPLVGLMVSAPVMEWMAAMPPLFRGMQRAMGVQFFSEQPVPAWFGPVASASFDQPLTRHTWRQESSRFRFDGPDPAPIDLPILVLHGDDDRVIPLVVGEWLHERAARSEMVIVEGGSHSFPVTHPESTAQAIAAFGAAR